MFHSFLLPTLFIFIHGNLQVIVIRICTVEYFEGGMTSPLNIHNTIPTNPGNPYIQTVCPVLHQSTHDLSVVITASAINSFPFVLPQTR